MAGISIIGKATINIAYTHIANAGADAGGDVTIRVPCCVRGDGEWLGSDGGERKAFAVGGGIIGCVNHRVLIDPVESFGSLVSTWHIDIDAIFTIGIVAREDSSCCAACTE